MTKNLLSAKRSWRNQNHWPFGYMFLRVICRRFASGARIPQIHALATLIEWSLYFHERLRRPRRSTHKSRTVLFFPLPCGFFAHKISGGFLAPFPRTYGPIPRRSLPCRYECLSPRIEGLQRNFPRLSFAFSYLGALSAGHSRPSDTL